MAWTVAELKQFRRYPQDPEVIAKAIALAEEDLHSVNPELATEEPLVFDRFVDRLVQIDLGNISYGVNANEDGGRVVASMNDARSKILLSASFIASTLNNNPPQYRPSRIYPPRSFG